MRAMCQVYGLMERYQGNDTEARELLQRARQMFGEEYDFWGGGSQSTQQSALEVGTDYE